MALLSEELLSSGTPPRSEEKLSGDVDDDGGSQASTGVPPRRVNLGSGRKPGPKMFRFTVKRCRKPDSEAVQLSQLQFRRFDGDLVNMKGAMVKNPNGVNPRGMEIRKSIDGSKDTAWRDFNKGPLVITFSSPPRTDAFRFITASDFPEQDPVMWSMEASVDGIMWIPVHQQEEAFECPRERQAETGWFDFLPTEVWPVDSRGRLGSNMTQSSVAAEPWSLGKWLTSLRVSDLLARKLDAGQNGAANEAAALKRLQELGRKDDESAVLQLLMEGGELLQDIARRIHAGAQQLATDSKAEESAWAGQRQRVESAVTGEWRKTSLKSMVDSLKVEMGHFLESWDKQEELLKRSRLIQAPLLEILEERLNEVVAHDAYLFYEDEELQKSLQQALERKRWVCHAGAVEAPLHLMKLLALGEDAKLEGRGMSVQDDLAEGMPVAFGANEVDSPLYELALHCLGHRCEVKSVQVQEGWAWCSMPDLDKELLAAIGLDAALARAELLAQKAPEFLADLSSNLNRSTGLDPTALLRDLRAHLDKGEVPLPLSVLVPEPQAFDAVLAEFPEAQDKEVCFRMLARRFLDTSLERDGVLRFYLARAVTKLAGDDRCKLLAHLHAEGGSAGLRRALPGGVVHSGILIGAQKVPLHRVTAEECKAAGISAFRTKALGFNVAEVRSAWDFEELRRTLQSPMQLKELLNLDAKAVLDLDLKQKGERHGSPFSRGEVVVVRFKDSADFASVVSVAEDEVQMSFGGRLNRHTGATAEAAAASAWTCQAFELH